MNAQFTRLARRLLIFNLLLQLFDGVMSYQVLSAGALSNVFSPAQPQEGHSWQNPTR